MKCKICKKKTSRENHWLCAKHNIYLDTLLTILTVIAIAILADSSK